MGCAEVVTCLPNPTVSFHQVFDFLHDLNKNNSKVWMDEHRDAYRKVRSSMLEWINNLDKQLQKIDPEYAPTPAKKAITRINNNLVYQPNATTYRNYIGTELNQGKGKISFYVHVSLKRSFIDGGF